MSLYKDLANAQLLDTMESTAQYAALSPDDCSTMFAVFVAESAGEDGVDDILEEMADMTTLESASIGGYDEVMERTIVKLDKRAKKNQLYKTALYTVARNENDPDYKKLVTLWQMEKYINRMVLYLGSGRSGLSLPLHLFHIGFRFHTIPLFQLPVDVLLHLP